jgi:hypothetical protein
MGTLTIAQHIIVEQLSLFLQLRRRKWTGLQPLLDENHLTRPMFFLLRALEGETARGEKLTLQDMQRQLFNPYATRFPIFASLPLLANQGYLEQQDDAYSVTESGRSLCDQVELAARSYISTLHIPPPVDLPALAIMLMERVHRSWQAAEPLIKTHQARTQRRLSIETAPAVVQAEWGILGLWEARDDAHMAAWQAHQFSGPVFDILTHIWNKEAQTLPRLLATLAEAQEPEDIRQGLLELTKWGYVVSVDTHFELSSQGQKIRDDIEAETDRIFFASWDQMKPEEVIWLSEQLSSICSYFKDLA